MGILSSDKMQNQVIRTSIIVNNKSRNDLADVYLNTSSGNLVGAASPNGDYIIKHDGDDQGNPMFMN